jgi:serine protease Do
MNSILVRLSLIILALTAIPAQAQRKQPSQGNQTPLAAKQIAARVLPSVVLVETSCGRDRTTFGSGFVVGQGMVATNKHIVECGDEIYVTLIGQGKKHRANAKYLNTAHDLAILKAEGVNAPPLPLSDTQNLSVGDKVYAAGNPKGLEGTFSDGIISGLRYSAGRIQFTAAISQGSSGGPVVDEYGRVIGVTVSYVEGQNLNFAVPTVFLKTLIADVRSGKALDALAVKAPTTRPMPRPQPPVRLVGAVGYTLIVDNSSTLKEQFVFVKRIARALIESNGDGDGARVVSFTSYGGRNPARFTTDRNTLLASVESIEARSDGWTHPVIDALVDTIQKAARPVSNYNADAVIVLTHGMDGRSEASWEQLRSLARESKVPVYCILFTPDQRDLSGYDTRRLIDEIDKWRERMKTSEQMLRIITQESGGRLFIPDSEEQLDGFAREIMRDLHKARPR